MALYTTNYIPVADADGRLLGQIAFRVPAPVRLAYTTTTPETGEVVGPGALTLFIATKTESPLPLTLLLKPAYVGVQDLTVHVGFDRTPSLVLRGRPGRQLFEINKVPLSRDEASLLLVGKASLKSKGDVDRLFATTVGASTTTTRIVIKTGFTGSATLLRTETEYAGAGAGSGAGSGSGSGSGAATESTIDVMRALGKSASSSYAWCITPALRSTILECLSTSTTEAETESPLSSSSTSTAYSAGRDALVDMLMANHGVQISTKPFRFGTRYECERRCCASLCVGSVYGKDCVASYSRVTPYVTYTTTVDLSVVFVSDAEELPLAEDPSRYFKVKVPATAAGASGDTAPTFTHPLYQDLATAMGMWLCEGTGSTLPPLLVLWAAHAPRDTAPAEFKLVMDAVAGATTRANALAAFARTGLFALQCAKQ